MKKKIILSLSLIMALFLLPINGFAYTINNEFNLGVNEGSSQVANNQYILLHETANETATGRNEAQYMQRSWTSAYTAYIVGDGGIVYQVGQLGYVQYGAGSYANAKVLCKSSYNTHMIKKLLKRTIKYTLNWQEIQQ